MKLSRLIARLIALAAGATFTSAENFDAAIPGQPPAGWTATQTGSGTAHWTVEKDPNASSPPNLLKQSGAATYPICLKDEAVLKDGFVEVKFKSVAGREDQAGGVICRCQDADNYYVARANALEDNVTIYHTIDGRRISFKSTDAKVTPAVWHTLRVEFSGTQFTVIFDGHKVIEANDGSITAAGKVGVWTKADSITLFDDFAYGEKVTP